MNVNQVPDVPIYTSLEFIGKRIDYFVEISSLPTWISVNTNLLEDQVLQEYHPDPRLFVDMISYWLWQFDPDLSALMADVRLNWPMTIYVDLDLDKNWQTQMESDANEEPLLCEINPEQLSIRAVFYPPIIGLIQRIDNWGEMVCMRIILENVSSLLDTLGWELEARRLIDNINNIIEQHSKIPNKKKVLSINPYDNPTLLPGNLASFRNVQQVDRSILLDELGEYLTNKLKLPIGPIADEKTTWVLNKSVEYYFIELKSLVSSLSPKYLIDFLISHYDAIVHERAIRKLTIPTELACFSKEYELVNQLDKQIPEINEAALACRFIIEYVTTQPPNGIRPISLSVYDRLLALSSEIIGRGQQSDLIEYGIYKLELAILESRRLGINHQRYSEILKSFLGVRTLEEVDQAVNYFHRWWEIKSPIDEEGLPQYVIEMDRAFEAEFGIALRDISKFISDLGELSVDASRGEPVKIKLNTLINQVQEISGWKEPKITKIVDFLSLGPRKDFLKPEMPFQKTDVFPWRLSRGLSYIRRPLIKMLENEDYVIYFGIRHLFESLDYILQMVITGRLQSKYHSKEMQSFLGEVHRQDGERF